MTIVVHSFDGWCVQRCFRWWLRSRLLGDGTFTHLSQGRVLGFEHIVEGHWVRKRVVSSALRIVKIFQPELLCNKSWWLAHHRRVHCGEGTSSLAVACCTCCWSWCCNEIRRRECWQFLVILPLYGPRNLPDLLVNYYLLLPLLILSKLVILCIDLFEVNIMWICSQFLHGIVLKVVEYFPANSLLLVLEILPQSLCLIILPRRIHRRHA